MRKRDKLNIGLKKGASFCNIKIKILKLNYNQGNFYLVIILNPFNKMKDNKL